MKRTAPLAWLTSVLFIGLIVLVGGLIGGLNHQLSSKLIEDNSRVQVEHIIETLHAEMNNLKLAAGMTVNMLRHSELTAAPDQSAREAHLGFLHQLLIGSQSLSAVYVGYDNGDFFLLRRVFSGDDADSFAAPPGTAFIMQSIEHGSGNAHGEYVYFNNDFEQFSRDERSDYARVYDPRQRAWYRQAKASENQIITPPYLYFSSPKVGTTLALRSIDGKAVVATDIRLETLSKILNGGEIATGTELVVVNSQGRALAHEHLHELIMLSPVPGGQPTLARLANFSSPVLQQLARYFPVEATPPDIRQRVEMTGTHWLASISPIAFSGAPSIYLISAIPEEALLAGAYAQTRQTALWIVFIIFLAMPLTWLLARHLSGSFEKLATEAQAIKNFDFSGGQQLNTRVREVHELAEAIRGMKRTIRRFLEINRVIAAEQDFERLLPRLMDEVLSVSQTEYGILYLADETHLVAAVGLCADASHLPDTLATVENTACGPLLGSALQTGKALTAALQDADIHQLGIGLYANTCCHGLAVPLLNRQQALVGVILLWQEQAINEAQLSFISALAGSAAISLETRGLIKEQKALFEAFIQLIASAIDAKSPYTAGHCARVPVLTEMLAQAACEAREGAFKEFSLDAEQWEALHLAAWLHDCGKVTSPEYVVDKATKLETIYDRIHEIRMRFEVLKRDVMVDYWQGLSRGEEEQQLAAARDAELAALDADFAFVAACNEGGEFMSPQQIARLQQIAKRKWARTLDDRIGISQDELLRKQRTLPATLPVAEPLLADKPEHMFERRASELHRENNRWGFRMEVPELLYHKGELHNLCIRRGTLSEEDRYKINEHIVQTIAMLGQLPFPKHLSQVPDIACNHHEKMDGTGYPRRLTREQMLPTARMMAIADIFEALTAVDRPYKKGKKLSEAIRIMALMKQDQHIDAELFELFLRSGTYLRYAERFMQRGQIDTVDLSQYLATDDAECGSQTTPQIEPMRSSRAA